MGATHVDVAYGRGLGPGSIPDIVVLFRRGVGHAEVGLGKLERVLDVFWVGVDQFQHFREDADMAVEVQDSTLGQQVAQDEPLAGKLGLVLPQAVCVPFRAEALIQFLYPPFDLFLVPWVQYQDLLHLHFIAS